ncbi:MAG TPA: alpha/beta hydrolase, partial [Bacillota bacterium]|nr:alpha/beta hydrolase [Bacillota bacterium]
GIDEEWLTRDVEIQQYYHNSKMCGQPFTLQANFDLTQWVSFIDNKKNIAGGNLKMPIFLASGDTDPLSNYGKDIKRLFDLMVSLGYENVHMKLYKDCRHEILNELIKDEVYQDILTFFEE